MNLCVIKNPFHYGSIRKDILGPLDQDKLVSSFDYCNNVLMIPTNDARFLLQFEMRTISHRNIRTYTR